MSKTLNRLENRERALEVLRKELGSNGLIDFLQDMGLNYGNYTQERKDIFKDKTLEQLIEEARSIPLPQPPKP